MAEDSTPSIDIDYVARLARVALTDEEKQTFSAQLGDILGYFETLNQVDVSNVEPTAHAFPVFNVWQKDEAVPPWPPEVSLRNAPARQDNQVVVPRVVGEA